MTKTTILVCTTCRYSTEDEAHDGTRGGAILLDHMMRAAQDKDNVRVQPFECLMGCDNHCNVQVRGPGKIGYMLSRFAPDATSAEAIAGYADLHQQSASGQVPYRQWPQGVKGHFAARIPPLEGD